MNLELLTTMLDDLRYSIRTLLKNPGFTVVAILTLALGIGANTAIFSLLNALILRELPVREPHRLVALSTITPKGQPAGLSYLMFEEIRRQQKVLSSLFTWSGEVLYNLEANGTLWLSPVSFVTGDYYRTLGVVLFMGRAILPEDEGLQGGSPNNIAVISFGCWQRRFRSDPAVVGKVMRVEGKPYTIAAHGIREHMTVGRETNNINNNAPYDPIYWNWLINRDFAVWYFRYPGPGLELAFVRVDGEEIAYRTDQITYTVVDHWSDRRSGLSLPSKWNLVLASDRGTLVLDISAHGRAFFPWVQVLGVRLEIWMLCSARGKFHHPNGNVTVIDEQLMCVNPLQFLTYAEESLSGNIGALPQ